MLSSKSNIWACSRTVFYWQFSFSLYGPYLLLFCVCSCSVNLCNKFSSEVYGFFRSWIFAVFRSYTELDYWYLKHLAIPYIRFNELDTNPIIDPLSKILSFFVLDLSFKRLNFLLSQWVFAVSLTTGYEKLKCNALYFKSWKNMGKN